MTLHPASRLACWTLLVLTIQCLGGTALLLTFALLPCLGGAVLRHWLRLLRRTRWLLLSLLLILGWGVAGEAAWDSVIPAPTLEGLTEASIQAGRLALVLAAVALLLERTPVPMLMAGCYHLLRPLQALGIDIERAVARLMLSLHYAETLPPVRGWRDLLSGHGTIDPVAPAVVRFAATGYRAVDLLALLVAASILLLAVVA